MLRGDVELLPARPARHGIVDTNHVVPELGEQRAIAVVGSGRNAILPRADHPSHLIIVRPLATRAGELVGTRLVPVVEEVAFVERHGWIIAVEWNGREGRTGRTGRMGGTGWMGGTVFCDRPAPPALPALPA
jgi:hypothetical protein